MVCKVKVILPIIFLAFMFTACEDQEGLEAEFEYAPEGAEMAPGLSPEQITFWDAIREHCGNAYAGRVGDATPFYGSINEAEDIRIHVRNCTDDLTHISLHIDENHSRNLLLTRELHTLRLKHDHRYPDGTEEEITQYGGDAPKPGLETRQIFESDQHTADILPDRFDNFWFLDMMDEETFAYGVHWPMHGHSIRIEFDISETVDPPPTPWGY